MKKKKNVKYAEIYFEYTGYMYAFFFVLRNSSLDIVLMCENLLERDAGLYKARN